MNLKESLQKAEIPAAQGRAAIFRSCERLKNEEKSKIAFGIKGTEGLFFNQPPC
jgi:hypothetical protein